jgi:hypothetical protein
VTKRNFLIILFAVILLTTVLLSISGIINIGFHEIFYFLLMTAGIAFVYIGIMNETGLIIFTGTGLFLIGVLLLSKLYFNVELNNILFIHLVTSVAAAGFLLVFISKPGKKYLMVISFLLFILTAISLVTFTKFELTDFFHSILPLLEVYWPALIICMVLIVLLKKKNGK